MGDSGAPGVRPIRASEGKACTTMGHMKMSGNWEAEACVILKGPPDDSGNIISLPIISQMNSWAFFYGLL